MLGCRDIASGIVTRKLHCGLKLGREIVLGVVTRFGSLGVMTRFLMSQHGLAKWVSRHGFGVVTWSGLLRVATRLGQGRLFACRDTDLGVATGQTGCACRNWA